MIFFFVLAAFSLFQFVTSPRDRVFTGILSALCLIGSVIYFVLTKQIVL